MYLSPAPYDERFRGAKESLNVRDNRTFFKKGDMMIQTAINDVPVLLVENHVNDSGLQEVIQEALKEKGGTPTVVFIDLDFRVIGAPAISLLESKLVSRIGVYTRDFTSIQQNQREMVSEEIRRKLIQKEGVNVIVDTGGKRDSTCEMLSNVKLDGNTLIVAHFSFDGVLSALQALECSYEEIVKDAEHLNKDSTKDKLSVWGKGLQSTFMLMKNDPGNEQKYLSVFLNACSAFADLSQNQQLCNKLVVAALKIRDENCDTVGERTLVCDAREDHDAATLAKILETIESHVLCATRTKKGPIAKRHGEQYTLFIYPEFRTFSKIQNFLPENPSEDQKKEFVIDNDYLAHVTVYLWENVIEKQLLGEDEN